MVSSVQFRQAVVSGLWQPHGLQHARIPCPSLTLPELAETQADKWSDYRYTQKSPKDFPDVLHGVRQKVKSRTRGQYLSQVIRYRSSKH